MLRLISSGKDFFSPVEFDEMFRVAVGVWGVGPPDFWTMTCREFWWMFDVRKPPPRKVGTSSFTEKEVEELARLNRELQETRRGEGSTGDTRPIHG